MNVSLTPELEKFVDGKVESGLYNNASEVVREGLRLLKEHDEIRVKWREQIERGWLQAQAGQWSTATPCFTKPTSASSNADASAPDDRSVRVYRGSRDTDSRDC